MREAAEKENPYDQNAVSVWTIDEALIGHLSKQDSARYHPLLMQLEERGRPATARACLAVGGTRRRSLQVAIDVLSPRALATKLHLRSESRLS